MPFFHWLRVVCGLSTLLLLLNMSSVTLSAPPETSDQRSLPPGALRQWGEPITPFRAGTQSAAFCPKTGLLALGDGHGTVRLWNVENDAEVAVLPQSDGGAFALSFSADGSRLAAAGRAGFVVYCVPERRIIRSVGVPTRNAQNVRSLSFGITPDGKKVATVREGRLRVYDVDTGELVQGISNDQAFYQTMALSPDGQTIAVGTLTGEVLRLRLADGRAIGRPIQLIPEDAAALRGGVMGLAYSPDGRELFVAHPEIRMRAYDARTGDRLRQYAATNPGRRIAIGGMGEDQLIALRDGESRTTIWKGTETKPFKIIEPPFGFGVSFLDMAISPDGKTIASPTTSGSFDLVELETMQRPGNRFGHAGAVIALAASPDGRRIASLGEDRQLRVISMDPDSPLFRVRVDATVGESMDFQQSSIRVARARQMRGSIFEVDLQTGAVEQSRLLMVNVVGLIPGTQTALLAAARNSRLQLWDSIRDDRITEIAALQGQPFAISITSPGRRAAVFEGDAVSLWDVERQTMARRFSTDLGNVRPAKGVIADDASVALILGNDGTFRVIEMLTGGIESLAGIEEPVTIPLAFRTAAFVPGNTRYLLTLQGNRRPVIVDLVGKTIVYEFPELDATVTAIAFTPDRQRLITGFDDGTIMLWNFPDFKLSSAPRETTDAELVRLWDRLSTPDGMEGYRAARQLAEAGPAAVALIRNRLSPAVDQAEMIAQLISELSDERFRVREQAAAALIDLGPVVRAQLQELRNVGQLSIELTERIDNILLETELLQPETADLRRTVRALAALKWINTPEAISVIEAYAAGAEDAVLTVEARRGLEMIRGQE